MDADLLSFLCRIEERLDLLDAKLTLLQETNQDLIGEGAIAAEWEALERNTEAISAKSTSHQAKVIAWFKAMAKGKRGRNEAQHLHGL